MYLAPLMSAVVITVTAVWARNTVIRPILILLARKGLALAAPSLHHLVVEVRLQEDILVTTKFPTPTRVSANVSRLLKSILLVLRI